MMARINLLNNLKICHWNANGLLNKWSELKSFIHKNNIDLMLINEVRASQKYKFKLHGYVNYRLDRPGPRAGGGLLILVKNNIKHSSLNLNFNFTSLEAIGVKVENSLAIISVYARPVINGRVNVINNVDLDELMNCAPKVIALGDFNAKHQTWGCIASNRSGRAIHEYINNKHLAVIAPQNFTLYPLNGGQASVVDFAIVKNYNSIASIETLNELDSDHLPVFLELGIANNLRHSQRYVTDYKNANWKLYRSIIKNNFKINSKLKTRTDVDDSIGKLEKLIITAKNIAIPEIPVKPYKTKLPRNIQDLIRFRNAIRRKYQRTKLDYYKLIKNTLTNIINAKIRNYNNDIWDNKLKNLTVKDKSIWKIAKSLTKNMDTMIPTLNGPNGPVFTDNEKANVLAENFERVHHLTENFGDDDTENVVNHTYTEIKSEPIDINDVELTSPKEVLEAINKTKPRKAPGPDGIQNILLKNLPKKAIVQIMYVINTCLKMSYFPIAWKKANVLAFPKQKKDKSSPQNYRPISLLPTLSKIFEIIIFNRIKKFEYQNKNMREEQFGFREKRSTVHQLARIANYITTNFNQNKSTVMTLLDIEKAFDTVWHKGLIHKLKTIGLPIYIVKLLQSYLKNRTFSVIVNGVASNTQLIAAGVPQGSILGPQLFSYYINDLPIDNDTMTALFADDTAIYRASWNKKHAIIKLQETLNNFMKYYTKWKIKINATKTECIVFSHKKKLRLGEEDLSIKIDNELVYPKSTVKYLGVTLDQKLKYNEHITKACNQAFSIRNLIFPLINKKSKLSVKNKLILYKALIKPILLYATPIWSNASKKLINKIQVVQNKTLRLIADAKPGETNNQVRSKLDIKDIKEDIYLQTQKFYQISVKQHKILKDVGTLNRDNAPFKIKHKLPHSLLWDTHCT